MCVRPRRDRHVAALAVGQHEQTGFARGLRHGVEGGYAGGPEALEARELRLDGHARGAGGFDRRAAVEFDRRGGELGRLAVTTAYGLDRDLPQGGRVGVEAEDDLAAPLLDERGEPVSEGENGSDTTAAEALPAGLSLILRRCALYIEPLTAFFRAEPALKRGTRLAAIWIRSPVCGFTPWRAPRSARSTKSPCFPPPAPIPPSRSRTGR